MYTLNIQEVTAIQRALAQHAWESFSEKDLGLCCLFTDSSYRKLDQKSWGEGGKYDKKTILFDWHALWPISFAWVVHSKVYSATWCWIHLNVINGVSTFILAADSRLSTECYSCCQYAVDNFGSCVFYILFYEFFIHNQL